MMKTSNSDKKETTLLFIHVGKYITQSGVLVYSNGKFQVKSASISSVGEEDLNQALMKYIFPDKMIKKDQEKKL